MWFPPTSTSSTGSPRPRPAREPASGRCSRRGRGWGTTAAPAICTRPRWPSSTSTGGRCRPTYPLCARFPAWGSTRRAPSWSSPSSVTRRSSTSTWRGCCNGRCPARRSLRRAAQTLADSLVPAGRAWAWNQALMELGAATCSSRAPACGRCPLSPSCAWRNSAPGAPDPAARGPRQSRFEGSDRQGRGRLVDALRSGPVPPGRLRVACGWPEDPDRARRVADDLVAEGLARRGPGDVLVLP